VPSSRPAHLQRRAGQLLLELLHCLLHALQLHLQRLDLRLVVSALRAGLRGGRRHARLLDRQRLLRSQLGLLLPAVAPARQRLSQCY
jgi:hypothetical protein